MDEMELRRYFAPTEDFTDAEALAYRAASPINTPHGHTPPAERTHALAHLGKRPAPQPFVKPVVKERSVRGGKVVV